MQATSTPSIYNRNVTCMLVLSVDAENGLQQVADCQEQSAISSIQQQKPSLSGGYRDVAGGYEPSSSDDDSETSSNSSTSSSSSIEKEISKKIPLDTKNKYGRLPLLGNDTKKITESSSSSSDDDSSSSSSSSSSDDDDLSSSSSSSSLHCPKQGNDPKAIAEMFDTEPETSFENENENEDGKLTTSVDMKVEPSPSPRATSLDIQESNNPQSSESEPLDNMPEMTLDITESELKQVNVIPSVAMTNERSLSPNSWRTRTEMQETIPEVEPSDTKPKPESHTESNKESVAVSSSVTVTIDHASPSLNSSTSPLNERVTVQFKVKPLHATSETTCKTESDKYDCVKVTSDVQVAIKSESSKTAKNSLPSSTCPVVVQARNKKSKAETVDTKQEKVKQVELLAKSANNTGKKKITKKSQTSSSKSKATTKTSKEKTSRPKPRRPPANKAKPKKSTKTTKKENQQTTCKQKDDVKLQPEPKPEIKSETVQRLVDTSFIAKQSVCDEAHTSSSSGSFSWSSESDGGWSDTDDESVMEEESSSSSIAKLAVVHLLDPSKGGEEEDTSSCSSEVEFFKQVRKSLSSSLGSNVSRSNLPKWHKKSYSFVKPMEYDILPCFYGEVR